jgi:hypothetical protein
MSLLTFELKEEHVKLLKNLRWSVNKDNIISAVADEGDDIAPPFGETNLYEAIDLILNGKPEGIDPFTHEEIIEYSLEQKQAWDKLYNELPLALDIIMFNGNFNLGKYKTRFHDRNWKKLN